MSSPVVSTSLAATITTMSSDDGLVRVSANTYDPWSSITYDGCKCKHNSVPKMAKHTYVCMHICLMLLNITLSISDNIKYLTRHTYV